ncbi:MAG: hypothetical protein GWN84_09015 [Gammaproteobacteria bacterium]|nr:hypothetical protein [Gammaproteobacteria bacterium]NIR83894.1 hypothetical protein [Gammaproteobacteria bacterium]NIR90673.1 hypothetical protein [Gammaproteobacteria bacterium]NIV76062.1 hypothetical protein [Gammaproteobacteria bacterium]
MVLSTEIDGRRDSAWRLVMPGSRCRALGFAVMLATALHTVGAVLFFASWVRHPQSALWLAIGMLSFAAALGLWRMLAWARLVTVFALWLGAAVAGLTLINAFMGAPDLAALPRGPVAAGAGAIAAAGWVIHLLGKHRARFHDRLI